MIAPVVKFSHEPECARLMQRLLGMAEQGAPTSIFDPADSGHSTGSLAAGANQDESGIPIPDYFARPVVSIQSGELDESGRYYIQHLLGRGAFGGVYLANDTVLGRRVAIKVIDHPAISRERVIAEARAVAKLSHPNIVVVYDTGLSKDGFAFIVLELIEERALSETLSDRSLTFNRAVDLILAVTQAAGAAHLAGIVHRDLKPANILVDGAGKPRVTDFGLAQDINSNRVTGEVAGTPGYMAPEQIRGESHRIDARTDLWAIGAILFELLAGQKAVSPETHRRQARNLQPLAPLVLPPSDKVIPPELLAICRRCMAFAQGDRYQSAFEIIDDLKAWTEEDKPGEPASRSIPVVPKGLWSFDESDGEFFLTLLPGPVDRFGLPGSIRFWKQRVETRDPASMLTVGVCYGSSGCGKSSLIRAGLLPRLTENIAVIWITATPQQTESQLLERLRRSYPLLPRDRELADSVAWIRAQNARHPLAKTLIVIDQFEQWLSRPLLMASSPLASALRQCDGHVACLVIIRDDFWLPVSRFMQLLEIPLKQGQNVALVDLFDIEHAVRVLTAFGAAWNKLEQNSEAEIAANQVFLRTAVNELAIDGRVACIHLVFFAEAWKKTDWTLETLRRLGGPHGSMERHLDELLSRGPRAATVPEFETPTRQILSALLPADSNSIKGQPQSRDSLIRLCGPTVGSEAVGVLLDWLDQELRLISRQENDIEQTAAAMQPVVSYQLTHDFLVGLVRSWLERRRRETARGRAEILLAERTRWWKDHPSSRQLPGFVEWLRIRAFTRRGSRSLAEQQLLRAADNFYLSRTTLFLFICCLIIGGTKEVSLRVQAAATTSRLIDAEIADVPAILAESSSNSARRNVRLQGLLDQPELDRDKELRIRLGLLSDDPKQISHLLTYLRQSTPDEVEVISAVLKTNRHLLEIEPAIVELWNGIDDPEWSDFGKLRVAALLANHDQDNLRWKQLTGNLLNWLSSEPPHLASAWIRLFTPIGPHVTDELAAVIKSNTTDPSREIALEAFIFYQFDHPGQIVEIVPSLHAREFSFVFEPFRRQRDAAIAALERKTNKLQATYQALPESAGHEDEQKRDQFSRQISKLIFAEALLSYWPSYLKSLEYCSEPRLRTLLIHESSAAKLDRGQMWKQLASIAEQEDHNPGACSGLLLALGSADREKFLAPQHETLLKEIFTRHPDPGVHSAAEWLLRVFDRELLIDEMKRELAWHEPRGKQKWYILKNGLTFAVIEPIQFTMGGPKWSKPNGTVEMSIKRRYAISTTKVTTRQYSQLFPGQAAPLPPSSPASREPVVSVSLNQALNYCLLLGTENGIVSGDQSLELANDNDLETVVAKRECLRTHGYRLPTSVELEAAFRAGTTTLRHFGYAPEYIKFYEWYLENSGGVKHPVALLRPNSWGLFDCVGNVFDICLDTALRNPEKGSLQDVLSVNPIYVKFRGGAIGVVPDFVTSSNSGTGLAAGQSHTGFRVARTLP